MRAVEGAGPYEKDIREGECLMAKTLNMTQGSPWKLLLRFSLPLMLGNVFQQLYTVVDTAIVGRGVGMDALAALGCVDWLNWMMLGIAQGFTQGFSVRIAQAFGANDQKSLGRFMGQSAVATAGLAVLCTLLGLLGVPLFLQLLRVPSELVAMSGLYIRILFAGLPVVFFFNFCSAMLRAVGDSKTPLIAMTAAAVTNIALDLVAVYALGWGIAGAAAATVFAQCLSGTICLVKILRTPQLRFRKETLRPHWESLRNLLRIGTPVALKNIAVAAGGMIVMAVVNTFGTTFIAGFTASNKLYGLLEIAALSYGFAINTYVGQNYGAGKFDRIRSGMKSATVLALATSVVITALMFLLGRPITMLFISTENPLEAMAAGNIAYRYLCVMAAGLSVLYMLYLLMFALQGLRDTVTSMVSGFVELSLRIAVSTTVALTGYEMGILAAEPMAWIGCTVYLWYHYRKKMKK